MDPLGLITEANESTESDCAGRRPPERPYGFGVTLTDAGRAVELPKPRAAREVAQ